jgi:hypothetical protein
MYENISVARESGTVSVDGQLMATRWPLHAPGADSQV